MKWPMVSLEEVLSLEYGAALPAARRDSSGSIPVAGSNGVDGYHVKALVKGPGIVVGRKGSAGKVVWFDSDFWPIDTTFYVRPKIPMDLRWIFYLLLNLRLDRLSIITGVPGLNRNDAYNLKVPLPPLSEQRRIVEILDQADALRKKRAEADAKAERILSAFFITVFGDPTTNQRGWDIFELGDLCAKITSGSRDWARHTGRGDYFFVRTQDVNDGEISNSLLTVDPPSGAEADRTRLCYGDVVVTITGIVGKAAVFRAHKQNVYVSQHVALVRPKPTMEPEYLAAYANFPSGNGPLLARFQYGQTKPGLGFRELRTAKIPLPPIDLQRRFVSQIQNIRALKQSRCLAKTKLEELWAALLQRAFSGDLTATWREDHIKELLAEMEQQAKCLTEGGACRHLENTARQESLF